MNDAALMDWLGSARARLVLRQERAALERVLPRLFGRTLLQVGNWGDGLLGASVHWRTGVVGGFGDGHSQVVCDLHALPLMRHSVDAILLPHSLETVAEPHQLLREADRSLTNRGQLIILGFNPWSWWGMRQHGPRRFAPLPEGCRPLRAGRVSEWLSVLDYEIVTQARYGPGGRRWPRVLQPLLAGFATGYLLLARKRSLPVNPLRQRWRERTPGMQVARLPSARSSVPAARNINLLSPRR